MKILVIQHDAADPPAAVAEIAEQLGHELQIVRLDKDDPIPDMVCSDVLMSFGGGVSLALDKPPDWVANEKELIRKYVDGDKKVLGICLGSQMIAAALGAKVHRNPEPEVGWRTISMLDNAPPFIEDTFDEENIVFHWHQDTFEIPEGATHVFSSQACVNQGFVLNNRVVGFQFHLEANEKTVRTFLAVSKLWRQDARFVQSESQITAGIDV